MEAVDDLRRSVNTERAALNTTPGSSIDDSRLAMMRRVKRLPSAERIALLDRVCREHTQIAVGARKVR